MMDGYFLLLLYMFIGCIIALIVHIIDSYRNL